MSGFIFLMLAGILAGFALINITLPAFLTSLGPVVTGIGILAILLFSFVLIVKGIIAIFKKC